MSIEALHRARGYLEGFRRAREEYLKTPGTDMHGFVRSEMNELYRALDAVVEFLELEAE